MHQATRRMDIHEAATMKTRLCSTLLAVAALLPSPAAADDVKDRMHSLLGPFRGIQPYLVDEEAFSDRENHEKVESLIVSLRKNFHTMEDVPSRYHQYPGFDTNLQLVIDLLNDASRRFSDGKTSYAWWRLRMLPPTCFACHATYNVKSSYSNQYAVDPSLDPLDKGRFLLATRQFNEAKQSFLAVLQDPDYTFNYDEVLRSLLVITTRNQQTPAEGAEMFEKILSSTKLPEEDAHLVSLWVKELKAWSKEKQRNGTDELARGEKLIVSGATTGIDFYQNDVALLRGTALVQEQLDKGSVPRDKRAHALYLLGFAYLQMPLFFAESWAEMYLEQCISEFPGSKDAKQAFTLFRNHILDDYTGTAGTDVPDDVKLRLEELRKKAYGVKGFSGRV